MNISKIIILLIFAAFFSHWVFSVILSKRKNTAVKEKIKNPLKSSIVGILIGFSFVSLLTPLEKLGMGFLAFGNHFLEIAGVILGIAGISLYFWSKKTLGENWSSEIRIFSGHRLITTGPYRIVRHPIYLSEIILGIGGGLVFGSYLAFIFVALLILGAVYQAKLEENFLMKRFGKEYLEYKKQTSMISPFF